MELNKISVLALWHVNLNGLPKKSTIAVKEHLCPYWSMVVGVDKLVGTFQSFPSPRLVALPRLKNLVCPTILP